MKKIIVVLALILFANIWIPKAYSCSVIYYIDKVTGNIYVANNEDYWYDVKAYIQINPSTKNQLARLWYGWDNFAQGGINEAGLFFDGAVTPEQEIPNGYGSPKGNLGDEILANCKNVKEAIDFLEEKKIALKSAHMLFGDANGDAVVLEWVNGIKKLVAIRENKIVMTNFLLSDTTQGNFPCYRYRNIQNNIEALQTQEDTVSFLQLANVLGSAAQTPREDEHGKIGGTLYSSFINITDMEFVLVYQ